MRLLDRYLLRELVLPLCTCLLGFLIIWVSFDIIDELDDFGDHKLGFLDIAEYYFVLLPELLVTLLPVALLLALLYALTTHARYHELTAMRAAGLSLWRITMPYFLVAAAFSLLLLLVNEFWVPGSAARLDRILQRNIQPAAPTAVWHHSLNFRNARANRIWNIRAFNTETSEMRDPQVSWQDENGAARSLIARSARRVGGTWVFHDVQEIIYRDGTTAETFDPAMPRAKSLTMPQFQETPEQIRSEIKISQLTGLRAVRRADLSIRELLQYLHLHPDLTPERSSLLRTQLHARMAAPWTCLVVVLIAVPFGAASGRRNIFAGVAGSIFITFAYFILLRSGLALGSSGYLPPWVAAWLPNVAFAALGISLIQRVR